MKKAEHSRVLSFFDTPAAFRAWLEEHGATASELLVGFYKVGSGRPSMTWPESVDEAICYGWIDGVRRRLDDESYTIRFSPRRAGLDLERDQHRQGRGADRRGADAPRGLEAFARRIERRSGSTTCTKVISSSAYDGVLYTPPPTSGRLPANCRLSDVLSKL